MPPFRATYREEKEEKPHSITALFRKHLLTAALKTEGVQGIRWSRQMPGFSFSMNMQWNALSGQMAHCQLTEKERGSESSRNAMTGNEYDMELSDVFSAFSADVIVPGTVMFIVTSPFDIAPGPSSPRRK